MLRDKHHDLLHLLPSTTDWKKIKGFRNRIVHDYLGLDMLKVFRIVHDEVPALLNELYANTQQRIADGTLDREELQAAMKSDYYGKVQFSRLAG